MESQTPNPKGRLGIYSLVAAIGTVALYFAMFSAIEAKVDGTVLFVLAILASIAAVVLGLIALIKKQAHTGIAIVGLLFGMLMFLYFLGSMWVASDEKEQATKTPATETAN